MLTNRNVPIATKAATAHTVALENGTERKNRSSSSGSRRRGSTASSPTVAVAAISSSAIVEDAVQPARGAAMMA